MALLALAGCDERASGETPSVFPIGTVLGASVEAQIGPAGGALSLGPVRVVIPAGAVGDTTTFRITPITRTAPHGSAPAYRLEPHGRRFAAPVELAFTLDPTESGSRLVVYQDEVGHWVGVPDSTYDAETHTLRVATSHFSDWTYAESFVLHASEHAVRTGGSTELVVKSCYARGFMDPDGYVVPALVATCEPVVGDALLDAEAVNGAPGGSATHGTVARHGSLLRYAAPDSVPDANPVAISVQVEDIGRDALVLVVAHVTVVDDVAFRGRTEGVDGTITADVTWTESEAFGDEVQYVPSGLVTYSVPGCSVTPAVGTIDMADGYLEVDYASSPPRYYGSGHTSWEVTVTCGATSYPWIVLAQWFESGGPQHASPDGRTLAGASAVGSWSFERTP